MLGYAAKTSGATRGVNGLESVRRVCIVCSMTATLTALHRATRKVVRPAISGKEKVILTEFGQPCAEIRPLAEKRIVSEDDLRASQISDEAILAAISEAR